MEEKTQRQLNNETIQINSLLTIVIVIGAIKHVDLLMDKEGAVGHVLTAITMTRGQIPSIVVA